ncbi:inactive carboxypeptidase-like protein X2 [Homarus americanus]|uniref:inactive carboxypeptidase-like protein X2 n=1 Tax=Homarus americanus TaxID=6706 RepID=UPI001C463402|nr:inactive carboxypeptidase-like protein X2 [Homarus americanus]
MKPAMWYLMMIVVGFFYVYLTAVQYIRGQEVHDPPSNYQPQYDPQYYDENLISPTNQLDFEYHDYDSITNFLRSMSATYPNLTALYSVGKSVQGTSVRPSVRTDNN